MYSTVLMQAFIQQYDDDDDDDGDRVCDGV